jgi:hypothetical protein
VATHDKYGTIIPGKVSYSCSKCLSNGHREDECIAKCDQNGKPISLADQNTSAKKRRIDEVSPQHQMNKKATLKKANNSTAGISAMATGLYVPSYAFPEDFSCSRYGLDSHSSHARYTSNEIDGFALPMPMPCGRCGRDHDEEDCYASTDINGRKLTNTTAGSAKKKPSAASSAPVWTVKAAAKKAADAKKPAAKKVAAPAASTAKKSTKNDLCRRCGRDGHWADSCYARSHVSGERLA